MKETNVRLWHNPREQDGYETYENLPDSIASIPNKFSLPLSRLLARSLYVCKYIHIYTYIYYEN
jgi:hypothetical protein